MPLAAIHENIWKEIYSAYVIDMFVSYIMFFGVFVFLVKYIHLHWVQCFVFANLPIPVMDERTLNWIASNAMPFNVEVSNISSHNYHDYPSNLYKDNKEI